MICGKSRTLEYFSIWILNFESAVLHQFFFVINYSFFPSYLIFVAQRSSRKVDVLCNIINANLHLSYHVSVKQSGI